MTTLPTWLVIILGMAGPVVALAALFAAEIRDRRRLEHEREIQHLGFEEHRVSSLREDRREAYSTLARMTKVTRADKPEEVITDLSRVLSEIELLTDDDSLLRAAASLVVSGGNAALVARKRYEDKATQADIESASAEVTERRTAFIRLAKEELKQQP